MSTTGGEGQAIALPGFVAVAPPTIRLVALAARVASRATNVLVTGETGTGKGRLARAMHDHARGKEAPFVTIDCGGLPAGLAESELFGHEAGAFSDASGRRQGRFELSQGGTVLLDCVEVLPVEMQAKLLRVLQERAFERVGGRQILKMDATVIATSSADLPKLVEDGTFREDLYYRLDVVHLELPPLRDREQDIGALAEQFLREDPEAHRRGCRLTEGAVKFLSRQSWPGNVRQLRNVISRAAATSENARLDETAVEQAAVEPRLAPDSAIADLAERNLSLVDIEALYIERVMKMVDGRVGRAAKILGIHRKTLLDKRKRYGLD